MHSKIRRYSAHLTEPNEHLSVFWGLDATNKCFWGELNEILLRSTPMAGIIRHFYIYFILNLYLFKRPLKIEHMEIAETIYKV